MAEFTQNAKQILRGKDHIADCIDAETAEMIVQALQNYRGPDWRGTDHVNSAGSGTETEQATGHGNGSPSSNSLAGSTPAPAADQIADYLDAQADKRPRRRQFTQGIRFAAQEVRARMWEADEPAPEGVRARYNEETAHG